MNFCKNCFGADFVWGVSTAAYQIEGAHNTNGKGLSIWDVFTNTKGKIRQNENGNVACDFYHRYTQDLTLMHLMNIPDYRFSLSWSRLLPNGTTGHINHAGVDFYNRLIDFCLELGITPWATIYHWDLPYELEKRGGWNNRQVLDWFADYTAFCIKKFGDRVKHWMVMNEPMAFTGAGHFFGIHAPGKKGLSNFLSSAHHAALCQAEGGRIIKSLRSDCKVGTTFSASYIEPLTQMEEDIVAAKKVDALLNRLYLEPLLGLGYPTKDVRILQRIEQYMQPGDEAKLAFDMDFVGLQNYTRELVRHSLYMPYVRAQIVKAEKRYVPLTSMNWEIYPECIYEVLKKYAAYPNMPEILVTENGAAFPDEVTNGAIHDEQRTQYLQSHLEQVLRAKREGVNVNGYFVWTFLDNFEWAEGYHPRFGLVHVDFKTQKRTIKDSGHWYRRFLQPASEAAALQESAEHLLHL